MKQLVLSIIMVFLLAGCGEPTLDASSEESIKSSVHKISDSMTEADKEVFNKAIMYFSVGGKQGVSQIIGAAFSGVEIDTKSMITQNLKVVDGLTGDEILKKYQQEKAEIEQAEAEREQIDRLKAEAEALVEQQDFQAALDKYKQLSSIPNGVQSAQQGISNTKNQMAEFTKKMNYIDNIAITEFVATRIDTYNKKGVPAVRIALKNNGDKSLDWVRVTVYFQDSDNKTIYEQTFAPVSVSKYNFSRKNDPLKPGYVREMESGKYFIVESPLSEWKQGNAFAKISDIEFTK